ncbi:MAG: hypothetical protein RQ824_00595 [bacterium]|nr:hypothetical protein [bacterium]
MIIKNSIQKLSRNNQRRLKDGEVREMTGVTENNLNSKGRSAMRNFLKSLALLKGSIGKIEGVRERSVPSRSKIAPLVLSLSLCIAFFSVTSSANAAEEFLSVDSNGASSGWGGAWTDVQFSDGTAIGPAAKNARSTFGLTAPTGTGVITNVAVIAECMDAGGPEMINGVVRTGGTDYLGTSVSMTGAYSEYQFDWATNPGGGNWTWAQLAALEAGVEATASGGWGGTPLCNFITVMVTYVPQTQDLTLFEDISYDEYTPVSDVPLAKVRTSSGGDIVGNGYSVTAVTVTLGDGGGTPLSPTGPINVYYSTIDDLVTAKSGGSKGICASPVVGTPCNFALSGIGNETGYMFFTIDLVSGALGDYDLTVSSFTIGGASTDLIPLPKTTAAKSVKPPTQTLDYFFDYAQRYRANVTAPVTDLLLARINTNATSEGKPFANVSAGVFGTISSIDNLRVWWNTTEDFGSATKIGEVLAPTRDTLYNIDMTLNGGGGYVRGYIYFSISMPDAGNNGGYSLHINSMRDNKGPADDNLPLPRNTTTNYLIDPYKIQVCAECHAYPPYDAPATRGTPTGAVLGNHSAHARFNMMKCSSCHGDTTSGESDPAHRNNYVELRNPLGPPSGAGVYSRGYTFAQSTTTTLGTCSAIECHNGIAQTWGTSNTMVCNDCHLSGSADTDDFTYDEFTSTAVPRLYSSEWAYSGHGKSSGNYDLTGNPAAGLDCTNCHDSTLPHGDSIIPYRTKATGNMDIFCQNCHGTSAEIGSLFTTVSTVARGIKTHSRGVFIEENYKSLGTWRVETLKCIDCHDPHGDGTSGSGNKGMLHKQVWTGGSDTKGRPLPFDAGYSTVVFNSPTGVGGYGNNDAATTYICEVCHSTTSFHQRNGGGTAHFEGIRCPDCHQHDKGWAPYEECTECHAVPRNYLYNVRQIVEKDGDGAGDFVKLSRHVSNGTATEIVTSFDCVVCHAEGDYAKVNLNAGFTSATLHNDGSTSGVSAATDRKVHLRDVDNPDSYFIWNKNESNAATKETYRTNMDNFCMACHDTDGASGIAVNAGDNGLDLTPTADIALKPFNSNDTIRNGRDGFTSRTRVVDVWDQFNPGSGGSGAGYNGNPSQHGVRGARYSTKNAGWNASNGGAWTTHTLKDGTTVLGGAGGAGETAMLHCSDCHLSETNAHGATNAWHMLLNGTVNDHTSDTVMGGQLDTTTSSVVCYKCHNSGVYSNSASTLPRWSHDDDGNVWGRSYGNELGDKGNELGPTCLQCHAGDGFGRIHGRGSATDGDQGATYGTNIGTYGKYRFMPGAYQSISPGTNADDTAWTQGSGTAMTCYLTPNSTWSGCSQHSGAKSGGGTANYGRALTY